MLFNYILTPNGITKNTEKMYKINMLKERLGLSGNVKLTTNEIKSALNTKCINNISDNKLNQLYFLLNDSYNFKNNNYNISITEIDTYLNTINKVDKVDEIIISYIEDRTANRGIEQLQIQTRRA